MRLKRTSLKRLFFFTLVIILYAPLAIASEKMILKVGSKFPETYPLCQGLLKMGEVIEKETNGKITFQYFFDEKLGKKEKVFKMIQNGQVDITTFFAQFLGKSVPELEIFNLPYLFRNEEHYLSYILGQSGKELLKATGKASMTGLSFYNDGQRSFYANKAIRSIEDLKGLKIRILNAPVYSDMVKSLNGTPAHIPFNKVAGYLQKGIIDAAENNYASWITKEHYKYAKYYMQDAHLRIPHVLVMSTKTWEKLDESHRNLFMMASAKSAVYASEKWNENKIRSIKIAEQNGCEIVSEVDPAPFQKLMKPLWKKYGAQHEERIAQIQAIR
ncbi:TRAP transporter substrate-binding protein DctP [Desulfococcaceae bacterium HSG8]|nr:TRAP transporter substrate-binding protein DctP [Desulfococcaceae bacterium HSG8]